MKLYYSDNFCKLYNGNMLDMISSGHIKPMSIDCIVTDPPYELNFMGKSWDNQGISFQKETWKVCYDAIKPGGYLLAFGGSRTYHRIACAIEDAGFEIRDTIMWIYGSGFPKSMNLSNAIESKLTTGSANKTQFKNLDGDKVKSGDWGIAKNSLEYGFRPTDYTADEHLRTVNVNYTTEEGKQWEGWGTCLKPAFEPVIVARKPFDGSLVNNVLKYGVGGLNIGECRIGTDERVYNGSGMSWQKLDNHCHGDTGIGMLDGRGKDTVYKVNGRFPANLILTYDDNDYGEVCGGFPSSDRKNGTVSKVYDDTSNIYGDYKNKLPFESYGDSGSASRYFYCAKASKKDREDGLQLFRPVVDCDRNEECYSADVPFNRSSNARKNIHPSVKPVELMQYLVRLVAPKGATILDPFMGSGSTGKAVMFENKERNADYKFIGVELSEEYLPIAEARIKFAEGFELDSKEIEKPQKSDEKVFEKWGFDI